MNKIFIILILSTFLPVTSCHNDKYTGIYDLDNLSDSICLEKRLTLHLNHQADFIVTGKTDTIRGDWKMLNGVAMLIFEFKIENSNRVVQATYCEGDKIDIFEPDKFLDDSNVTCLIFHKRREKNENKLP